MLIIIQSIIKYLTNKILVNLNNNISINIKI